VVIKLQVPRPRRRPCGVICQRQPNDQLCKTKPLENLERKAAKMNKTKTNKKLWPLDTVSCISGKIVIEGGFVAIFLLSAHDKLMIEAWCMCVFAGKSKRNVAYDKVINCQTTAPKTGVGVG